VREIFGGARGPKREAVLLNAAGAIAAGGHAQDLADAYPLAAEAVDSGAAAERLEALIAFSREKAAA
jgi:anthranilate phosphoribosyltransferase